MKGSIYVCWGEYGGFRIELKNNIKRIVIGKFAIGYMNRDIEVFIVNMCDLVKKLGDSNERS